MISPEPRLSPMRSSAEPSWKSAWYFLVRLKASMPTACATAAVVNSASRAGKEKRLMRQKFFPSLLRSETNSAADAVVSPCVRQPPNFLGCSGGSVAGEGGQDQGRSPRIVLLKPGG
eukprot:CAMPEP_0173174214 /NCGR_PEP_ID=MMETSP1141-20130122/3239_1 /TAXON_ID=483371 /ORGANISM="non described non described, Strain CCMP2298" /LENGTH=116 /DNA_ID=CAMNT_0014096335 /DNA_START=631 /DNA_END=979 /DNA_ORIENTATION=-